MISIYTGAGLPSLVIGKSEILIYIAIYLAITLAFYALRSIGIYVLAKRQQIKCARLAFIPLIWFYVACKIVGNVKFFNRPIEKLATILVIIFSANGLLTLIFNVLAYYPIVSNILTESSGDWAILLAYNLNPSTLIDAGYINTHLLIEGIYYNGVISNVYGAGLAVVNKALLVIDTVSTILGLVCLVVEVTVYMGLFRKYIPQHHLLFMILSVFIGIFAPLVFAIRKKNAINYVDYLRSRYYARGGYGNPYDNPYGNSNNNPYNNPYENNQNRTNQASSQTPFEEFAEKGEVDPGDPFEEFNNKDKK